MNWNPLIKQKYTCRTCKHYKAGMCQRTSKLKFNYITGKPELKGARKAETERKYGFLALLLNKCGIRGHFHCLMD